MISVASDYIPHQTPTTFHRTIQKSSIFEERNSLTRIAESMSNRIFNPLFRNKNLNLLTSHTNFKIKNLETEWDESENLLLEDFDFYVPIKPQKTLVVKAKVASVKKFTPKPLID